MILFNIGTENKENIDADHAFECVRQLLLNRKVTKAVTYLWKTCMILKEAPDMRDLSTAAKEECLFAFLLKIFIESENKMTENKSTVDASKSEQDDKKKEEQKRIINYYTVRKRLKLIRRFVLL